MEAVNARALEWGVADFVPPGHSESGDLHVVAPFPEGFLVAALDGLGHGKEAAAAAKRAAAILKAKASMPVIALARRCHERLRATRGVVMSLASFNVSHGLVTWLGVGNVQGVLCRSGTGVQEALLLRAGVIGGRLPLLKAQVLPIGPGDMLIFATDGIRDNFAQALTRSDVPQKVAENILRRFAKGNDDALVLVARFLENRE